MAHSGEEGFKASDFFSRHHDVAVSQLAVDMLMDRVQLSKSLQMIVDEESLRNEVKHLVLDFRLDYVKAHIRALRTQIAQSDSNSEQWPQLCLDMKRMMELRNAMAKKLGMDIII